jgi:hypothetical protein
MDWAAAIKEQRAFSHSATYHEVRVPGWEPVGLLDQSSGTIDFSAKSGVGESMVMAF